MATHLINYKRINTMKTEYQANKALAVNKAKSNDLYKASYDNRAPIEFTPVKKVIK